MAVTNYDKDKDDLSEVFFKFEETKTKDSKTLTGAPAGVPENPAHIPSVTAESFTASSRQVPANTVAPTSTQPKAPPLKPISSASFFTQPLKTVSTAATASTASEASEPIVPLSNRSTPFPTAVPGTPNKEKDDLSEVFFKFEEPKTKDSKTLTGAPAGVPENPAHIPSGTAESVAANTAAPTSTQPKAPPSKSLSTASIFTQPQGTVIRAATASSASEASEPIAPRSNRSTPSPTAVPGTLRVSVSGFKVAERNTPSPTIRR